MVQLGARMAVVEAARLRQPHDPGPDPQPPRKPRHLPLDPRGEHRAFGPRADQAHLVADHVDDLRQLVETEPAQHPAHRRRVRIASGRSDRTVIRLRAGFGDRAELQDPEWPLAEAEPLLPVQHRPAALKPNRQRDRRAEHDPERQQCSEK